MIIKATNQTNAASNGIPAQTYGAVIPAHNFTAIKLDEKLNNLRALQYVAAANNPFGSTDSENIHDTDGSMVAFQNLVRPGSGLGVYVGDVHDTNDLGNSDDSHANPSEDGNAAFRITISATTDSSQDDGDRLETNDIDVSNLIGNTIRLGGETVARVTGARHPGSASSDVAVLIYVDRNLGTTNFSGQTVEWGEGRATGFWQAYAGASQLAANYPTWDNSK